VTPIVDLLSDESTAAWSASYPTKGTPPCLSNEGVKDRAYRGGGSQQKVTDVARLERGWRQSRPGMMEKSKGKRTLGGRQALSRVQCNQPNWEFGVGATVFFPPTTARLRPTFSEIEGVATNPHFKGVFSLGDQIVFRLGARWERYKLLNLLKPNGSLAGSRPDHLDEWLRQIAKSWRGGTAMADGYMAKTIWFKTFSTERTLG